MKLNVNLNPKMLRETLCEAQSMQAFLPVYVNVEWYMSTLQTLIDECDMHRPLGPDGTHGKRHTLTCGCEDKGHGSWCDHSNCPECPSAVGGGYLCIACGHDWFKRETRSAKW